MKFMHAIASRTGLILALSFVPLPAVTASAQVPKRAVITEYKTKHFQCCNNPSLPAVQGNAIGPIGVTLAPDGDLWVMEDASLESDGTIDGRVEHLGTGVGWLDKGSSDDSLTPTQSVTQIGNPPGSLCGAGTQTGNIGSGPHFAVVGPDGTMWFTENFVSQIGNFSPSVPFGQNPVIHEFPTPTCGSTPATIIVGPGPNNDNNIWFAEDGFNTPTLQGAIATIDVNTKQITEYPIPDAFAFPIGLVVGPDGNFYFTEFANGVIVQMTPDGQTFNRFVIPQAPNQPPPQPSGLVVGPDNALWLTDRNTPDFGPNATTNHGRILRMTTAGVFTEFLLPNPPPLNPDDNQSNEPAVIIVGPGPNGTSALWFSEVTGNRIGRITTDGAIKEWDLPYEQTRCGTSCGVGISPLHNPHTLAFVANDGAIWFSEVRQSAVARFSIGQNGGEQ